MNDSKYKQITMHIKLKNVPDLVHTNRGNWNLLDEIFLEHDLSRSSAQDKFKPYGFTLMLLGTHYLHVSITGTELWIFIRGLKTNENFTNKWQSLERTFERVIVQKNDNSKSFPFPSRPNWCF